MLDTRARKNFDFLFDKGSDFFIKLNMSPSQVTIMALLIGIASAFSFYLDMILLAVILLWFSGFLDAVDGHLARKTNQISKMGTLMDIIFDRIVEISIIIAIAVKNQQTLFPLLLLTCSIIVCMCVFLTTGALSENKSKKSFYYQAGLMERTETFIFFTLIFILQNYIFLLIYAFTVAIMITVVQRVAEARKIFMDMERG